MLESAVTEAMRVASLKVGALITRVQAKIDVKIDRVAGCRWIGIDEISTRHLRYLTVVVNHDSGRLV